MARILIVDDDPNARLLVRTLAEHAGHDVIEANDGRAGYALALQSSPDLTIIDLAMPQMSGAEFVRALRADPRMRASRVALYTASIRDAAIADFAEMYGLCAVLPKPAEPGELIAAIERALAAPTPVPDRG